MAKKDKVVNTEAAAGNVYTYVGGGEDSPRVIEFMGRQKFVRGQATEVTDEIVLGKIVNNPCFVEGEVDQEAIFEADEEAKKEADDRRKSDAKITAGYQKKHKAE